MKWWKKKYINLNLNSEIMWVSSGTQTEICIQNNKTEKLSENIYGKMIKAVDFEIPLYIIHFSVQPPGYWYVSGFYLREQVYKHRRVSVCVLSPISVIPQFWQLPQVLFENHTCVSETNRTAFYFLLSSFCPDNTWTCGTTGTDTDMGQYGRIVNDKYYRGCKVSDTNLYF